MSVDSTAPVVEPTAAEDTPGARPGVAVGRPSALAILLAGIVGLVASFTLMVEKVELLINPAYVPSCNLNPVLSCGSVMNTPQAGFFGFPNPLIGIISFTVVIITGVLAVTKVRLPQWYWVGLALGTALGAAFVHYLIFQSLYRIGALCPYCMVVWAVVIPLLAIVASIALRPLGGNPVLAVVYQWRWSLVTLWFTALVLMILVRFWDYWSTLI
ncbi:vitamin K epoxide reductase family protein [[Mycobacterium] wendilense]|uniref:Vitamin K epoxide reductase family protein n=1 Tax=[Mycobacterium] wendilense TaxID=3064284 RepID=A0ABN9P087_9MYCO|nr:vitamin K epoxide reductase family protein [Mycolicibacterium sp. MU0050]CAJ1584046.1 vitamin K epoxide reductase family protein [Mycolicibacterium sp. MU0050]